jgi:hypothetical protein
MEDDSLKEYTPHTVVDDIERGLHITSKRDYIIDTLLTNHIIKCGEKKKKKENK